jgi:hypothetical protein
VNLSGDRFTARILKEGRMARRRYFGGAGLTVLSSLVIAACSSDVPTGPQVAFQTLTAAAPTIALSVSPLLRSLCYPARVYSVRGCPSGAYVTISNTGGGTLTWTSTRSATWLKRSPRSGTAPSTLKVWVDGTGLPPGSYYGHITVWATGATNSPQTIFVHVTRD